MGMTGFSDAEMALLSGLDAVAWVTRTRITYTDSFKREAIERYRRGESPVRIFRECFASMFVRQVRQCFSAGWADGFPRCRHRFPVM